MKTIDDFLTSLGIQADYFVGSKDKTKLFRLNQIIEKYASQAKPEPIKTKIDWDKIEKEFDHIVLAGLRLVPLSPRGCFNWLKERIEKELNSSE